MTMTFITGGLMQLLERNLLRGFHAVAELNRGEG